MQSIRQNAPAALELWVGHMACTSHRKELEAVQWQRPAHVATGCSDCCEPVCMYVWLHSHVQKRIATSDNREPAHAAGRTSVAAAAALWCNRGSHSKAAGCRTCPAIRPQREVVRKYSVSEWPGESATAGAGITARHNPEAAQHYRHGARSTVEKIQQGRGKCV